MSRNQGWLWMLLVAVTVLALLAAGVFMPLPNSHDASGHIRLRLMGGEMRLCRRTGRPPWSRKLPRQGKKRVTVQQRQ